jgi:methylmalonyl-CoA mutase
VLTGASEFPDIAEIPVSVLDVARKDAPPITGAIRFEPLPRIRLSEPYERLREKSDRLLRDTGARPKVFLANLGPLAAFNARATWAKNFFEAGGIEAVTNEGFLNKPAGGKTDVGALTAAFRSSGARLACICSSDEVYAKEAETAAKTLAKAGAKCIWIAGRPGANESELRRTGVGGFIFQGCDVLTNLESAYRQISEG